MARKKTPTNTNSAVAAVNLDDDEQLVEEVTTTKRIGRERRKPVEASDDIIDVEVEDDDAENDGEAAPAYPENSLANVLFGELAQDGFDNLFCTINIRRNPDSMNDRFLTPCAAVTNHPPLRNVELTADKFDIEDRVRSEYGGGHYFFQIYYDGAFRSSWRSTLADDPAAVARVRAAELAKNGISPVPAQPEKADPMDLMLNRIVKMKTLRDALFGDEQKRLEAQITELQRQIAERPDPTVREPLPENLVILEKALSTNNETLQQRLLDAAFPEDSGGHWFTDTVKLFFEHKEEIGGLLGRLLGGLAPQPKPNAIEQLMRQTPPSTLGDGSATEAPASGFRRNRQPESEASAETPSPAAAFGIDPGQISEPAEGEVFVITPDMIEDPADTDAVDVENEDVDSADIAEEGDGE